MVRTVNAKQAALRKAREKQLQLDADRDARDQRIVDALAEVMVALNERAEAMAAVVRIDVEIGGWLRRIMDEGVSVDDVSNLSELATAEVRRLTKQRGGTTSLAPALHGKPASS
jgi:hypothetical protein